MNVIAPARMVVVKREDKETRLRAFVDKGLAACAESATAAAPRLRVLAQSPSSPVMRTLAALATDLQLSGIAVELILTRWDGAAPPSFGPRAICRHLADVRCHDAHELLVIGTHAAWVGDCLRRDPATHDSFELHAANDALTARLAAQSFDRLWAIAVDLPARDDDAQQATVELAAHLSALPGETPPLALTRH